MIDKFKETSIGFINNDVYANRSQIIELYGTNKSTLSDIINRLKDDGLVEGQKFDNQDNPKSRKIELFNLDEIIAIGLRLRSDKAIEFQIWAISRLKTELIRESAKRKVLEDRNKLQQYQLDYFWDKSDNNDLYGNLTE